MYEIEFYEDENGYSEIVTYIKKLRDRSAKNKECRVQLNKIVAYFDLLQEKGTRIGEPVTKHLEGELWELRPLKERYIYAYYENNKFIILHKFTKKTKKLPKRELEQAKRNLKLFKERERKNDNLENVKG